MNNQNQDECCCDPFLDKYAELNKLLDVYMSMKMELLQMHELTIKSRKQEECMEKALVKIENLTKIIDEKNKRIKELEKELEDTKEKHRKNSF